MRVVAFAVAILLALASAALAADADKRPNALPTPFGPGADPLRPPREEPKTKGAGIVSTTLVVAGAADVEELRATGPTLFGVALEVRVAPDSTLPSFTPPAVVVQSDDASVQQQLFAVCLPTIEGTGNTYRPVGTRLAEWSVAIGDHVWVCSGSTDRLATQVDSAGMRVSSKAGSEWKGTLLLLFRSAEPMKPGAARHLVLFGTTVQLPAAKSDDAPAH